MTDTMVLKYVGLTWVRGHMEKIKKQNQWMIKLTF